jgi:small-conductance mechanosensitive channel
MSESPPQFRPSLFSDEQKLVTLDNETITLHLSVMDRTIKISEAMCNFSAQKLARLEYEVDKNRNFVNQVKASLKTIEEKLETVLGFSKELGDLKENLRQTDENLQEVAGYIGPRCVQ